MRAIQLDTDCEGPLALNDNAFELCRDFIKPQGDKFFRQVSRYDDYLADVLKKPGYQAGTTLKLILPFLKAQGLTNARIQEYSAQHVMLMPGAEAAYRFLHGLQFPIFAVSTSYRQFAEFACAKLGFDAAHIFCTELDLDRYRLAQGEATELRRLLGEIVAAADIELPADTAALAHLPEPVQEAIATLDRILGEKIPEMEVGAIYREINPVGGPDKARALEESLARTGVSMADTIYVGDSITDVQAFEAVRAGGGLSISFNGNRYAVNAAEVVVVADTAWPIALLTSVFRLWGKEGVMEVAAPHSPNKSKYLVLPEAEIEPIMTGLNQGKVFNLYPDYLPQREKVIQESAAMRAQLRGPAIASLG